MTEEVKNSSSNADLVRMLKTVFILIARNLPTTIVTNCLFLGVGFFIRGVYPIIHSFFES